VNWTSSVHELCKDTLEKTGDTMDIFWNWGNKEPPKYKVRDLVMLKRRNLKTRTLSQKLDIKLYGPFQVDR
jgi:hypothetical protein